MPGLVTDKNIISAPLKESRTHHKEQPLGQGEGETNLAKGALNLQFAQIPRTPSGPQVFDPMQPPAPGVYGGELPASLRDLAYGYGTQVYRPIVQIRNLETAMRRLQSQTVKRFRKGQIISPPQRPAKLLTSEQIPYVTGVTVSQNSAKAAGKVFASISIGFNRPADTRIWYAAQIAIKGYKANPNYVFVYTAKQSPASFLLEITNEVVTFAVASLTLDGRLTPINLSPTTSAITLNGTVTAPAAPSISQNVTSIPTGFQFQFNFETGLAGDVIDGYKIYRNTTNNSGTASVIAYVKQNATNTGVYTFQDANVGSGVTYFYWVSAVNTSGLESTLTAAQSGTPTSTAIYTASTNLTSGTKLGGDSGVAANGASNLLGLGGTPTQFIEAFGAPVRATATMPFFEMNDTQASGVKFNVASGVPSAGIFAVSQSGVAQRTQLDTTPGWGFLGAPTGAASELAHVGVKQFTSGGLLNIKNVQQAAGSTSGPTTTSTTFVDLPDVTKTITTNGGSILILFSGQFQSNTAGDGAVVELNKDGTLIATTGTVGTSPAANVGFSMSFTYLDPTPTAASHTYKVQWHIFLGGKATAVGTSRALQVVELA